MEKVAIILTVYNRKDVTIEGLSRLVTISKTLKKYVFDIYMTDDNSSDGTSELVKKEFPQINIIHGSGNLYWCGGMNKAWKQAVSVDDYDYFIWFNDDAILFDNALEELFIVNRESKKECIVTGIFQDSLGRISYGGYDHNHNRIIPDGRIQRVYEMNGNLVLIPKNVFNVIGYINKNIKHCGGDYEYGFRALRKGFDILCTKQAVGITNRHDDSILKCFDGRISVINRFKLLYSPKFSPIDKWNAYKKTNIKYAVSVFLRLNLKTLLAGFSNKNS